jgi:hypothetical protein
LEGLKKTKTAFDIAKGRLPPEKGMTLRKDGSVEFASDSFGVYKLRRIYPDGRLLAKVGREWEDLGKINVASAGKRINSASR